MYSILENIRNIDESFSTKFSLAENVANYLQEADALSLLIGVGAGLGDTVLARGAHNIIFVYLVEFGIVGLLLVSAFWMLILIETRFKAGLVMFPFLLASMSATTVAIPYLYVVFSLIYAIELIKKRVI